MAHYAHYKARIGNMLVSTVYIANCPIRGDHWETMVFRCNEKGKVTDFGELFCLFTNDDATGHANGIAWAGAHQ